MTDTSSQPFQQNMPNPDSQVSHSVTPSPIDNDFFFNVGNSDDEEFENMGVNENNSNNFSQPNTLQDNFSPNHLQNSFQDAHGNFVAQDDNLIAKRPEFNGITAYANPNFLPLLPIVKHKNASNRQLILDTETTGFNATEGDRIVEIGVVEMINRRFTGEKLHVYINPQRDMPEDAFKIHGISGEFLADKPVFAQIAHVVYDFLQGAELIAHNASFDIGFLQAEFSRVGLGNFNQEVQVIDTLVMAKHQYAGQRNTLDALVKRLDVGKQDRTFHGALLDAEILAEVYLAMTGGQVALGIDEENGGGVGTSEHRRFDMPVKPYPANADSEAAHQAWLAALQNDNPLLVERWKNMAV